MRPKVQALLTHGADVSARDKYGQTALMFTMALGGAGYACSGHQKNGNFEEEYGKRPGCPDLFPHLIEQIPLI